jgi:diaminopimelate decarboxylase
MVKYGLKEIMVDKLVLFPQDTTIDGDGQLRLGGHRAVDLAGQFGTPLYVYHASTIRHQIATYRQALATYPGRTRLAYASKAFLCTALARLMAEAGVGLDVASAGEIFIARAGGVEPAKMHLHGNNKSIADLAAALQAGVGRIVVDNAAELERLAFLAAGRRQQVSVWLRVTPGIGVKTHHHYTVTGSADSKFGFPPAEAKRAAEHLIRSERASYLRLAGLHAHLGSYFHQVEPVIIAVEILLDLASVLHDSTGWSLRELCPGGGWGTSYHPVDPPLPITPFVVKLMAGITSGCRSRNLSLPEVILEPGRSLVAQAGVALYTVGNRKVIPGVRTYVSIDGGLADNPRPALYQARYTALLANRAMAEERETVAIAGPFCESGDVLIQAVDLPIAAPGDLLAIPVSGAYQLSMGSNYNAALRPAVVFIEEGEARLVQRREELADLVRRDC